MIIAAVAIIAAAGIVAVIWISVAVAAIAINRAVNSQIDANAAMSMAAAMISVMPLRHSWRARERDRGHDAQEKREFLDHATPPEPTSPSGSGRSEEHTSELQSLMRISYADFCLKKKIIQ